MFNADINDGDGLVVKEVVSSIQVIQKVRKTTRSASMEASNQMEWLDLKMLMIMWQHWMRLLTNQGMTWRLRRELTKQLRSLQSLT